jgi:hypothetical protein
MGGIVRDAGLTIESSVVSSERDRRQNEALQQTSSVLTTIAVARAAERRCWAGLLLA